MIGDHLTRQIEPINNIYILSLNAIARKYVYVLVLIFNCPEHPTHIRKR